LVRSAGIAKTFFVSFFSRLNVIAGGVGHAVFSGKMLFVGGAIASAYPQAVPKSRWSLSFFEPWLSPIG
jgi:hypothetical protein